jgi:16S rRNA (cytosine967-C5)-methyltransferase
LGRLCAPGEKLINVRNESIHPLVASDISEERVSKMSDLIERQKLDSVLFNVMDAANSTYNQEFDRILLDVPCSNLAFFLAVQKSSTEQHQNRLRL